MDRGNASDDGNREEPLPVSLSSPSWGFLIRLALVAIGVVLSLQLLYKIKGVFLVVAASLVLALGVQPFLKYLQRRGLSRGMATLVMLSTGVAVAVAVIALVVPMLGNQVSQIVEAGPGILDDLRAQSSFLDTALKNIDLEMLTGSLGDGGTLSSIFGGLFNLITVGVLTPYFAYAMPTMKVYVLRLIRKDDRADFIRIFDEAVDRVSGFVAGNLVVSFFATVAAFVALLLIGVPYPAALAVWIGITDLIPVVGVFIGAIPALAVAYVELGAGASIGVALFIVAYQQVENYLIAPRVMKRTIDLSAPVVIISLMVGGSVAGVLGALLALPVAALISLVFNEFLISKRISAVRIEGEQGGNGKITRNLP